MKRTYALCYAEGRGEDWEAICVDFDIAVQGRSFDEVYHGLTDAVQLYLESLTDLSAEDQARLLGRRAPLSVRMRLMWRILLSAFGRRTDDLSQRAEFTVPCAPA